MAPEVEILVYGQSLRVRGDDPERIQKVARYLDEMMKKILGGPGAGLSVKEAMLTALNVADEWIIKKEELEKVLHELNERVDELLAILPE